MAFFSSSNNNNSDSSSKMGGVVERKILKKDDKLSADNNVKKPSTQASRPHIPTQVLTKFLVFSLMMFTLPLLTYIFTKNFVFNGNVVYGAGAAVIAVNLILAGYVLAAIIENDDDVEFVSQQKSD